MSNHVQKLEIFAQLATIASEDGYKYFDPHDPDDIELAIQYFDQELGFLSSQDRRDLMRAWNIVKEDNLSLKLFFNLIKSLQTKYSD